MSLITARMPKGPFMFDPDQLTDKSLRFWSPRLCAKSWSASAATSCLIAPRLKLKSLKKRRNVALSMRVLCRAKKPEADFDWQPRQPTKQIGTEARLDAAELIGLPVHLELWVKVRDRWSDDEAALAQLGYKDP